jgi:outer membrane lipoprotein carrier protein
VTGRPRAAETSSGSFEFLRPNRFRFVYRKPFEQSIVADGQTLWMHDVDLNQVTARKQAQVLGSTPAALIASASDLEAVRRDFNLQDAPDRDGLQWVEATPRQRDTSLRSVRLGFRGADLAVLDILDSFGQRSVLTFTQVQTNATVSPDTVSLQAAGGRRRHPPVSPWPRTLRWLNACARARWVR